MAKRGSVSILWLLALAIGTSGLFDDQVHAGRGWSRAKQELQQIDLHTLAPT